MYSAPDDQQSKSARTRTEKPRDARVRFTRRTHRIVIAATLVCVLVATASVGTALAWLTAQASVANRFIAGTAQPTIVEDFADGGTLKSNVHAINDQADNVAVYMRAVVTIAWRDEGGAQLWDAPRYGVDYNMTWGTDVDSAGGTWRMARDGLYYYTVPLAPGAATTNLIEACSPASTYDDRRLVVDIAVQAIQASPAAAVLSAWHAPVLDDGTLDVANIPATPEAEAAANGSFAATVEAIEVDPLAAEATTAADEAARAVTPDRFAAAATEPHPVTAAPEKGVAS